VVDVGQHLVQADVQLVVTLHLSNDHPTLLLEDRRGRSHPVQGLVATDVGMDHHGAVGLDHDEPQRLGQMGAQAAGVVDGAAGDDEAHGVADRSPSSG
jgi:hypothetical protein